MASRPDSNPSDEIPEVAEGAVFQPSQLLPQITGNEDYRALAAGSKFRDPEGKVRTKPYEIVGDEDYAAVPEGAIYVGPDKVPRTKPRYEGIGFTAEMLHDMAQTPEAQKQVLEKFYPGQVKQDVAGLYVDDNGTLRRPGAQRGLGEWAGYTAAEAAPLGGMAAGGALLSETGPGAIGGGIVGATAGRSFNNAILALVGIHQDPAINLSSVLWEGAWTGLGSAAAKIGSKIGSAAGEAILRSKTIGAKVRSATESLPEILESIGVTPERARYFLGTTPETIEQAQSITERHGGGIVAPSILAPEAPMLKKIEEFDQVFQGRNRFAEAARDFYEKGAKDLLEHPEIGAKLDESLTAATKSASSKRAGELVLANFQQRLAQSDAALEQARKAALAEARRPIIEAGGEAAYVAKRQAAREKLVQAQVQASSDAKEFVKAGIDGIRNDVETAARQMQQGGRTGTLWRMIGGKFRSWGAASRQRASILYDSADEVGGTNAIAGSGERLGMQAGDFLAEMPALLRFKYPEVSMLEKLAGRETQAAAGGGKVIEAVPSIDLSFKELRRLRSWLRSGIDYADLTPNMREGSVKLFARNVNELLHSAELSPSLQHAARILDSADDFYKETIPYLNDGIVKTVMDGLREGVPPDPGMLANVLFDKGRTEAMNRAREIIGPTLWKYVQAAHTQNIINKNLNLLGDVEAKGFANSVEGMYRDGTLASGYSKEFADRLIKAARNVQQLEGNLTLNPGRDESLQTLMDRAEMMGEQVKQMADKDPLKALSEGIKRVDKDFNEQLKAMRQSRRAEPLHFLYEKSMTALPIRAANRILADPDLIVAASNRFGLHSPEMDALRQVYVQRRFQRPLGKVAQLRAEIGRTGEREHGGITEEVQAIMFPGVTRDTMVQLVKDTEFLFGGGGTDIGGSLAAASRVLNPMAHIPLALSGPVKYLTMIPGSHVVGRFALGKFFKTIMDGVSHPNFINWLAGELKKGGTERLAARATLQARLNAGVKIGGAIGAFQSTGQSEQ